MDFSFLFFQALETLRLISDLDDIDFPSDLIGIEIKKETITYSEQCEMLINDSEVEDLKPFISDLDSDSTNNAKVDFFFLILE